MIGSRELAIFQYLIDFSGVLESEKAKLTHQIEILKERIEELDCKRTILLEELEFMLKNR